MVRRSAWLLTLSSATVTMVVAAVLGASIHSTSRHTAGSASATLTGNGQHQTSVASIVAAPIAAAMRTGVLMVVDDYEATGVAAKLGIGKKALTDDLAPYFAGPAAAAKFQGGGGIGAPMGCGAAAGKNVVDGAVIGTPVNAGGVVSVPVSLYIGTKQAAQLSVTADAAGKLTGFTCGPLTAPDVPGVQTLVGFYGGAAEAAADESTADDKISQLKQQFVAPAFVNFTRTGVEADQTLCAEDSMTYWHAVFDPAATTTGAQYYFWPGGGDQVNMSVAVDPSAGRVAWVYCFGQLIPRPGPGDYSDSQVQSYVSDLFNDYAYLLALKPYGADPSGIKAYFATDAAYQSAAGSTGAQPLECSATAAGSIGADSVTVSGTTAVVDLTSAPSAHPVSEGETALGHPKVTVDTTTLKFTAVSCA